MRFDVCERDIILNDTGALNLKYFNNKKGSYWSDRETITLKRLMLLYDVNHIKFFKNHEELIVQTNELDPLLEVEPKLFKPLESFSETEIRLRI